MNNDDNPPSPIGAVASEPEISALADDAHPFLQAIVASLPDPVFVLDEDGRYLEVLGGSERSQYDSTSYLIGRRLHEVMPAPLADGFLAEIRHAIGSGQMHLHEYPLSAEQLDGNRHDGPQGSQWFQGRIAPIRRRSRDGKACVVWLIVNITQRRHLEAELQRLATVDDLTGLLNRRAFLQRVDAAIQSAGAEGSLHLAMLDLDLFKTVNDRYGHLVGDALLQHVAQHLQFPTEQGTTQAGRLGGEEFGLLFIDCSLRQAQQRIRALQQRLRDEPLRLGSETIMTAFSAGLTSMVAGDRAPSDLLRRADALMYEAKAAGRGQLAYPGWVERRQR